MARSLAVVGTAGHIDHGKTALVRRLTGVDTDRLKEEKERGISIDLGFAPLTTPAGRRVGIVDVPGHERFVRNMLAGVGGIDAVLLVIAADDGVMPQTREHFAIVKLLEVPRGLIVLTKADLVTDYAWLDEVESDARALVQGSFLEGAPVVRFSAVTGEGEGALLAALDRLLEGEPDRPLGEAARLPIDRVFTVEGFGTVVTGTLWRGRVATGDTVAIEPAGKTARVRSVQVHGAPVDAATAGQRTAIALHGLAREDLARGDWVLAPGSLAPSTLVSARIDLLPDVPKALLTRTRVRVHLGSGEALGRVVLLEGESLEPGSSALAQLRLESPIVAARGDRFVLRAYSPMRTLGGGSVLEPLAERRKRGGVEGLDVAESGTESERVAFALREAGMGARTVAELAKALEASPVEVAHELDALVTAGDAIRLPDGRLLSRDGLDAARERIRDEFAVYGKAYPLRWGPTRGELKARVARALDGPVYDLALASLLSDGTVAARADRVAEASGRALTGKYAEAAAKLIATLEAAGMTPPELATIAPTLRLLPGETTELVGRVLADGDVVRLDPDFVWSRASWEKAAAFVRAHFEHAQELSVADVKAGLGLSRKWAVPLLEALDRERITKREGNARLPGPALASGTSA
jgi:selenocysteine-specific elongation factor